MLNTTRYKFFDRNVLYSEMLPGYKFKWGVPEAITDNQLRSNLEFYTFGRAKIEYVGQINTGIVKYYTEGNNSLERITEAGEVLVTVEEPTGLWCMRNTKDHIIKETVAPLKLLNGDTASFDTTQKIVLFSGALVLNGTRFEAPTCLEFTTPKVLEASSTCYGFVITAKN
jgi:hypothetical protein